MKKNILVLICIFLCTQLSAQQSDFYYTFNNNKINLTKISGKYLAEFPNGLANPSSNLPGQKLTNKSFLVTQTENLSNYGINSNYTPTYITDDGQELYYGKEILLQFKPNTNSEAKSSLITTNNLTLVKTSASFEIYKVSSDGLQISKIIYQSGIVEFCTPNFYIKFQSTSVSPPNDPYYNQQWYLNNTGQGTNDGKTTTVNADIDAPEAWSITLGNPNIVVAVIDRGLTSDHPDLPNTRQIRLSGSNFAAAYDGTNDPNNPSPTVSTVEDNSHGDACAGIIAATQNNGIGITGIAPLCKIMPIKIPLGFNGTQTSDYAGAIDFAVINNADIISNSWSNHSPNHNFAPAIVAAIQNAVNNNKVVVFAAGNNATRSLGEPGTWGYVEFPGNADIEEMITVGASDRNNLVANYSPNGASQYSDVTTGMNLDLVAPSSSATNDLIPGEAGNIWTIDIPGEDYGSNSWKFTNTGLPAFGELLPSFGTNYSDYTGRMSGTSAATPQVAAVAALMKSVNPCLNAQQIKIILEQTADKVGPYDYNVDATNPGISKQLGYGKLNAFKAVSSAQQGFSETLDLVIKDTPDDTGIEPNTTSQYMWNSSDMWIRNNPDNGLQHQNPTYDGINPNYLYVRVANKSCVTSSGNEKLKVYWAKAGTSLNWPESWDGTFYQEIIVGQPPVLMGNQIGTAVAIPQLAPGEETIVQVTWQNIPSPNDYIWFEQSESSHFCLLARIEAESDPMTFPETPGLYTNVANNNNIAWKNVSIINIEPTPPDANGTGASTDIGAVVTVGNPFDEPRTFYLELVKEDLETGKPIYDEAEVSIKMNQTLYNAWERGGKEALKLEGTTDEKKKVVKGNHVILDNLSFNAKELGALYVKFNFLTKEITDKTHYIYYVVQRDAITGEIIGGETYDIKKAQRPIFTANAGGDKEVDKNIPITIYAEQINEAAIYNWYDMQGNLIYQGKDLTVATEVTQKYKLEVIALADGFKDYTEVLVKLKANSLNFIAPNPATNNVTVGYKLNEVSSAYLMVIGSYGTTGSSNNYILDLNSSETTINLTAFANGFYTVALVCDGHIVDAKTLVKQ